MNELRFINGTGDLADALSGYGNAFTVTDRNVARLYPQLTGGRRYVLPAGEDAKTPASVVEVCRAMMTAGCDRSSVVLAVGGGVVGDIAGFSASVYMRGVRWVSVPTTLLAQVDSGIGGKTGVDLDDYKNIVGSFWLPEQILICPAVLATLDERERLCGTGEILKTAFLDEGVFAAVENALAGLKARDAACENAAVRSCAAFKHALTSDDFREAGRRKVLNVGHTVGHALEKTDRHRRSHGEYVLWGMSAEAFLTRGFMLPGTFERLTGLAEAALEGIAPPEFLPREVSEAAESDKKNRDGRISVMAVRAVGEIREVFFDAEPLAAGLADWQKSLKTKALRQ